MQKDIFGQSGEIIASNYLKKKNYKILELNYKNKIGEIDLIAKDGEYIVFVEVKTRMSGAFGHALEAVDEKKQRKIRAVASLYLMKKKQMDKPSRFDVVAIMGDQDADIEHIIDAF